MLNGDRDCVAAPAEAMNLAHHRLIWLQAKLKKKKKDKKTKNTNAADRLRVYESDRYEFNNSDAIIFIVVDNTDLKVCANVLPVCKHECVKRA